MSSYPNLQLMKEMVKLKSEIESEDIPNTELAYLKRILYQLLCVRELLEKQDTYKSFNRNSGVF